MSTTRVEKQVSLKLVVKKETNKVLFAEAGKDFVDVLCSFLTFPLGTLARLVGQSNSSIGCLNSLYQSVANLEEKYLWTESCKEMLMHPKNSSADYCATLKLSIDDTEPIKYFICPNLANCYSSKLSTCFSKKNKLSTSKKNKLSTSKIESCKCGKLINRPIPFDCDGFVKGGNVSFIITDDLAVKPNSMETTFGIFLSFGIKDTSSVKQMTVNVTKEKVMDLLKFSLLSKSALTDLFLETEPSLQPASFSPCVAVKSNKTDGVQIKVKLFMRKSDGKILFALGEEDFVDFILSLLTFPLGGAMRMLEGYCALGSIDGLYRSMSRMSDLYGCKYFMSDEIKNLLVDPSVDPRVKLSKQVLPIKELQPVSEYYCYYRGSFRESFIQNKISITSRDRVICSDDENRLSFMLVDPESSLESHSGGYVKGPAMLMVTDDLVVTPMTPTSALSLLDGLEIPPTDLNEKIVAIGFNEGCSILKAALTSSSALTNGLGHLLTQVKEEK